MLLLILALLLRHTSHFYVKRLCCHGDRRNSQPYNGCAHNLSDAHNLNAWSIFLS